MEDVTLDDHYAVRNRLVEALECDLVGPREDGEVLSDTPFATYICGVLYAADAGRPGPEQEVDETDDSDETTYADPPVSLANTRYPSSLGLTFAVDTTTANAVDITVTGAR